MAVRDKHARAEYREGQDFQIRWQQVSNKAISANYMHEISGVLELPLDGC